MLSKKSKSVVVFAVAALAGLLSGQGAGAAVIAYNPADLLTPANPAGSGVGNAFGVWFNAKTGFAEERTNAAFPSLADGQYMLRWNTGYVQFEAEVIVQGFFSRGNDLVTDASGNPSKFAAGTTITAASGIDGVIFSDLGPTFGNWQLGEYGFLGLIIGNGTNGSNVNYGYAEITVNQDASVTLHSFAWNDTVGGVITAVSTIPEPTSLAVLGTTALLALRRRR